MGSVPGWGRSPRGGNGNPVHYFCLENSMDRGAWRAIVHGVTKNRTWLSDWARTHTHTHTHMYRHKWIYIYALYVYIYIYVYIYMHVRVQLLQWCLLFATPRTIACQASLSMGFPQQKYWIGLPFPPPRDLPNPGIKPKSPESPVLADRFFTTALHTYAHISRNKNN